MRCLVMFITAVCLIFLVFDPFTHTSRFLLVITRISLSTVVFQVLPVNHGLMYIMCSLQMVSEDHSLRLCTSTHMQLTSRISLSFHHRQISLQCLQQHSSILVQYRLVLAINAYSSSTCAVVFFNAILISSNTQINALVNK